MTPRRGYAFLPATPLSPSRTLDAFLSRNSALGGPSTRLVRCFWNYQEILQCRTMPLGMEVPGHCQKQLTQTLIVRLLKTKDKPEDVDVSLKMSASLRGPILY